MQHHAELLTPAEMGMADRAAVAAGVPIATLMREAGRAVARAVRARVTPCPTLVLCGPGNNGGDGVAAARLLALWGWPVAVATPDEAGRPDWSGPTAAFTPEAAGRAGLVIDALFGAGLSRDLDRRSFAVLQAAPRLMAIDVPSGVDGATGGVRGHAAPAAFTVTFFRRKPGHLLLPGRTLCGELVLADIGMLGTALDGIDCRTVHNGPWLWRLPLLTPESHKYTRGHVTVIGGAKMTGATRLAAAAARRGGAGLVTIAALENAELYRAGAPGLIVDDAPLAAQMQDTRRNAWLCGPGLGAEAAARALPLLLSGGRHVVVDADALGACAGEPDRLRGASVLTPHAGEFARVFGGPGPDRLAAVRAAAVDTGAVVILKGSDSIIAAPDGRAAINDAAPPDLATAGAGDVLAGLVTALLGQGMPAWDAACAAVWLHGRAGALAGPGLIAEDLPPLFPRAFAEATG